MSRTPLVPHAEVCGGSHAPHLSAPAPAACGAGGGGPSRGPGASSEGARQGLRSEQRHAGDRRGPVVTAGPPGV